ncbi:hypothetical protein OOJ91_12930 [Micromonospora lupini]|uniref:hypothetical protein n=1 Tax=Micromonospora lupini TaxID=285679 RepID=UPI0022537179|nr:hypothetical protein [Micromonospora lupini]MCX5066751.1 hypothetical protein [Micromonospora lupini]
MRREQAVEHILARRREAKPPRRYTQVTLLVAAAALVDWMLVVVHAAIDRHQPVDAGLATHLCVAGTLAGCAAVLGAGWALLKDRANRDKDRDEIEEDRQERWSTWVDHVMESMRERELAAWADGIRIAGSGPTEPAQALRQASGGSSNPNDEPTVVLPRPIRTAPAKGRAASPRFGHNEGRRFPHQG